MAGIKFVLHERRKIDERLKIIPDTEQNNLIKKNE